MSARHKIRILFTSSLLGISGGAILVASAMAGNLRVAWIALPAGLGLLAASAGMLTPFGRPLLVRILAGGIALTTGWGAVSAFRSSEAGPWPFGFLASFACLLALGALVACGNGGWYAKTTQFHRDPADSEKRVPWACYWDPRLLGLSDHKLARFHPELFGFGGVLLDLAAIWAGRFARRSRATLEGLVQGGDARAAVVVSVWPLTVAVYTDELDAVALLEYPEHLGPELTERYGLSVGSRLLGLVTYRNGPLHVDLVRGPLARGSAGQVWPLVAEFICLNTPRIESLKGLIRDSEWQRATELGRERLVLAPHGARSGLPLESCRAKVAVGSER
jgi:hypothetical protein